MKLTNSLKDTATKFTQGDTDNLHRLVSVKKKLNQ